MSTYSYRIGEPFDGNSTNEGHTFLVIIFREDREGGFCRLIEALPRINHEAALAEVKKLITRHEAREKLRIQNAVLWARRKKQKLIDQSLARKAEKKLRRPSLHSDGEAIQYPHRQSLATRSTQHHEHVDARQLGPGNHI